MLEQVTLCPEFAAQKKVERQRIRVRTVIGDRIDAASDPAAVFAGWSHLNGYLAALLANDLIDIGMHADLGVLVTTAANDRLAALRGTPLNAPTGSPPKQPSPTAEPVGALSRGGH